MASVWPLMLIATLGVVTGTALGTKVLGRLPPQVFRRMLAIVLVGLGLYMAVTGGRSQTAPMTPDAGVELRKAFAFDHDFDVAGFERLE